MVRFRTLTQRFGVLYAVTAAILAGVIAVVTIHLGGIRLDSKRLLEEAREQTVTAQLIAQVEALSALVEQSSSAGEREVARAREMLRSTLAELLALEGGPNDPSREEHQEAETRVADRLAADLELADRLLAARATPSGERAELLGLLERAKHYAQVLLAEARDESREAHRDLQSRARWTRSILVLTWLSALVLLVASLLLVHRGVVRPLRALKAGTERFGRGDKDHRIRVSNRDEIGDLAASFNTMADRLVGAREDLEDRVRQRTREFIRAARLADLGILASGIAHEINTPLASISTSAEALSRLARDEPVSQERLRETCGIISAEALRAREITTRMLGLVRQESSEIASVPLRLVAEQAEAALRSRAERRGVRLVSAPVADSLYVRVNGGELIQILVNLIANAVDASPPGSEVELRVGTESGELVLEVADHGEGIADADLERVFEPFFTTKPPGEGTGLGLALVNTMVESRGGRISVSSELGRGSTFRVTLPVDWSPAS